VLLGMRLVGELLRNWTRGVSSLSVMVATGSLKTRGRFGIPGKTSSTGFLRARRRWGEPRGLGERRGDDMCRWPAASTPGSDCARDMRRARPLAFDLDLKWPREDGEWLRGRNGRVGDCHSGD
jgi:hypothetical protein